jgi:hypothetical protein
LTASRVLGPDIFGEGSSWPAPYARPADPDMHEFSAGLFSICQRLIDEDKLRHHPLRVLVGGIATILEGLDLVKSGTISGEKVVVKLTG